jgi:hypothetical protein
LAAASALPKRQAIIVVNQMPFLTVEAIFYLSDKIDNHLDAIAKYLIFQGSLWLFYLSSFLRQSSCNIR